MAEKDAATWLEEWLVANLQPLENDGEPLDTEKQVLQCRADAEKAGIDITELDHIAGGNLEAHLMNAQRGLVAAELRRPGETELA